MTVGSFVEVLGEWPREMHPDASRRACGIPEISCHAVGLKLSGIGRHAGLWNLLDARYFCFGS